MTVAASQQSTAGVGLVAAGHGLVLAGFMLPWVTGDFGAREQFSGLDLARTTSGLIEAGLGNAALRTVEVVLLAVPILAANALLLLVVSRLGLVSRRVAATAASVMAIGALVVTALVLVLVLSARGEFIRGPGAGLVVALVGGGIALVPAVLAATHAGLKSTRG